MDFSKKTCLGDCQKGEGGRVGTVKSIDKALNKDEKKVKVRFDDGRTEEALYVPNKFAKEIKAGQKYEFHLDEPSFRGGGRNSFGNGGNGIDRLKSAPKSVKESSFGDGSTAGRSGNSGGGGSGGRSF